MGLGAKAIGSALLLNKPQWELVQQQEGESWLNTRHRGQVLHTAATLQQTGTYLNPF